MGPFWLVWNEKGSAPTHKHDTEESARNEAERLARQCNGSTFHVLRLIGSVQKTDVVWVEPDLPSPDAIPF